MKKTSIQVFNTTIRSEGEFIFVKPVCDFFQIDYKNQVEKIREDPILAECSGKKANVPLFGDNYPRVYLTRRGFIRWIQVINAMTVPEHVQEAFVRYQADIFEFMYGSVEQESELRSLVKEDHRIDDQLKVLVRERRLIRAALKQTLADRYQYALSFDNQRALNQ